MELPTYSLEQLDKDLSSVKPRAFDTYILPGFLIYYAIKSKSMSRIARRILFLSGVYMGYRSYNNYKNLYTTISSNISKTVSGANPS